jgi:hypothetical protein
MPDLVWSPPHLAVLHLSVPAAVILYGATTRPQNEDLSEIDVDVPTTDNVNLNLWEGARAFWYPL